MSNKIVDLRLKRNQDIKLLTWKRVSVEGEPEYEDFQHFTPYDIADLAHEIADWCYTNRFDGDMTDIIDGETLDGEEVKHGDDVWVECCRISAINGLTEAQKLGLLKCLRYAESKGTEWVS
jgi:hypothetical protein